ncbi:4737_t:CDS:2 [Entrophospora sp. SA101]|nr:4737_t:CDS:2 [Entrophospora sp. SA101]
MAQENFQLMIDDFEYVASFFKVIPTSQKETLKRQTANQTACRRGHIW